MDILIFILMFAVLIYVYFIPSIIAVKRDHKNGLPIALLNLFLGWLFIPWVVAICWATTAQETKAK